MAPSPRPELNSSHSSDNYAGPVELPQPSGDEVVITGISGQFPKSDNVLDFMKNLYEKVDMVTGDVSTVEIDHPDIPVRRGRLDNVDKFDAQFFGVHYRQAMSMDPMCALLLENTYGAIIDAGLNPKHLRDTNTAVFVGISTSDAERTYYCNKTQMSGLGLTGTARNMLSNRLSYWLGVTGPSCSLNSACSSSLMALEHAYTAISSGQCDNVVVAGANICFNPFVTLQLRRLGVLSRDGKTKCFDKKADGYARGDAVTVMLLQKAKNAKRVYAEVVYAKSNCDGYNEPNVTYPNLKTQKIFIENFYKEAKVLPSEVEYIEAFGAGLPGIDKNELDAIDRIFCKDRDTPILVGSVKSNMGHAEAASGVAAVTKLCLAYQNGVIPPNLHCDEPRDDVDGLREGRIRVVTDPTPFKRGYAAVSSFSFSGSNVHVLLKGFTKNKKDLTMIDDLPRLVTASGRSESSLVQIFEDLESRPLDVEQISLLHNIHEVPIAGHVFRCYNVLKTVKGSTVSVSKEIDYYPGTKRPVWFVYSGMGSQWSGMGTQLMRIPIFAAAIERCHRSLAPKGIDLIRILTDPDPKVYDNILNSFVGIAAVQIGLTDILTALGIHADNIIGHSVGELGCAYADGCFTAEEMVLAAYSRGLVSVETPFIRGSMAAVGLGYDEVKLICPLEVVVACHNGPDSCTISGPEEAMKKFVGHLTAQGIFAKEVPCSNIAYHSKYIAEAGPGLLKYLKEVIKEPKLRSSRWVSTSVPQIQWDQSSAKYSSAEYHTNNLLNAVLFEETSRLIPSNAITIEIAPHGLLQAILRRSLASGNINVPLTKRGHPDNVEYLINAIGKLFIAGLDPKVSKMYPEVEFPVSIGTPMLSHLIGWEHSEKWSDHSFQPLELCQSGERTFVMSTCDEEYKFMTGNVINGLNLFPASGYLVLVWETLGMMMGVHYTDLSVVFENICFNSDMIIQEDKTLEFIIMIQKATGVFEIVSNGGVIVSGQISAVKSSQLEFRPLEEPSGEGDHLTRDDLYKMLLTKGYNYRDAFRAIEELDMNFNKGKIYFNNNWVTFLDSIIQVNVLKRDFNGVSKPKLIQKLSINVSGHKESMPIFDRKITQLDFSIYDIYDCTRCGGVELVSLITTDCPVVQLQKSVIQSYRFVPHQDSRVYKEYEAIQSVTQVVAQNIISDHLNIVEFVDKPHEQGGILHDIKRVIEEIPRKSCNVKSVLELDKHVDVSFKPKDDIRKADLVVITNLMNRIKIMKSLHTALSYESYVLSRESLIPTSEMYWEGFHLIAVIKTQSDIYVLLKKRVLETMTIKYITIRSNSHFAWVELVKSELNACDKLVLISECDPMGGLLGFFNCLRREPGGHVLSLLLISDYSAPAFRPDLDFYKNQLDKNIALNVYHNGVWGSYQYIPQDKAIAQSEQVYLASGQPEDMNSLVWLEGTLSLSLKPSDPNKILVQVYYSALTLQDVKKASSRSQLLHKRDIQNANRYGMDFCGRTSTGDRVMGLLPFGTLSSVVEADLQMLWPVPPQWSMEDAVTVPQAYANAFYCLVMQTSLQPGASVLIHSGAGALGQAAISICLAHGCDVYVTVGSCEKKKWLLKIFPRLKESNIGNSRNTDFEDIVMSGTKGHGCNIVINTLSGNLREVSLRCVSPLGVMVNLNQEDVMQNAALGMLFFRLSRTCKTASMSTIFGPSEAGRRKKIQQLVADGIVKGFVKPLSRIVFGMNETTRAFRYMSTGRNVGKVVMKIRDEELRPLVTPSRTLFAAEPHFSCIDDGNYLVISGSDDTGLELADWLVQRGAKKLLYHSKETKISGYETAKTRSWRSQGVKVHRTSASLQTEADCMQLLSDASKHGPVAGVWITNRSVYRDIFVDASPEHFIKDVAEVALIVVNLDSATRKLCTQLREFVVFSSLASGLGDVGYSSSGLAESVVERICEERKKLGLPALAVQWGGALDKMKNKTTEDEVAEGKLRFIVNGALDNLDRIMKSKDPIVASYHPATMEDQPTNLIEEVGNVIGVHDLSNLPNNISLKQLSCGTLAANEIQVLLERKFNIFLPPNRIIKLTLDELTKMQTQMQTQSSKSKVMLEGLDAFFRYIDPEEFNAGDMLVRMPTLLSDGNETEANLFKKDKYLVLVPGMEGHKNVLLTVTKRLKINAFACQLEMDNFTDTIPQMAAKMSKGIMDKSLLDSEFFLLGYSFGVNVALEIASLLECYGLTGKVICLDGGPQFFSALLDSHLGHLNEQQLQNEVIKHMFRIMSNSSSEQLERSLAETESWEQKVELCMRHLQSRVNFSKQYQRSLITMAYARITQARAYTDSHFKPLRSEIILLKARRNLLNRPVDADYGLRKYTEHPVKIFELDCDHASAPYDLNCSNIINKLIVNHDDFHKVNLCKGYTYPFVGQL